MFNMRSRIIVSVFFICLSFILFALPVFANNNADTNNSTISVSPSTIPADGSTTATISITLKDSLGNTLSGDHVTLTSTTDSGLVINSEAAGSLSSTAASDSNGKVTFSVKSSNPSPGTDTFTASDTSDNPSVPLGSNGSVSVTFTASALAPSSSCSDKTPGSTPQLSSAVASGSNQITLTWKDSSNPVSYYLVSYGIAPGKYIYGNPNVGGQGTTSYTINNLAKGTTYYFAVKAVNGCAPGSFSNEASATTTGGIVANTPTPTPSDTNIQNVISPTDTPTPTENIQSTPTPTQNVTPGDSKAKMLEYIIIFVLVIGSIAVFISWKYNKGLKKPVNTVEENQIAEKDLRQEK